MNAPFAVRAARAAWVTYSLFAANVAVFAWMLARGVSATRPSVDDALAFGANHGPLVADGDWERLYTSTFVHAGVFHLGFNLWALHVLGPPVERLFGNAAYFLLYTFAGVGGSIASALANPDGISVGASGAIFGLPGAIVAFYLAHRSEMPPGLFREQMKRMGTFLGINVLLGFTIPHVDNAAHAGGFLVGLVCGLAAYRDALATPRLSAARFARLALVGMALLGLLPVVKWRVTNSDASSAEYWLLHGGRALTEGRLDVARESSDRALEAAPDDGRAHEFRARLELAGAHPEVALGALDRALALQPDLPWARGARAWLRFQGGRFRDALGDLDAAIAIDPARVVLYEWRAQTHFALEEWSDALRDYRTLAGLDPARARRSWPCAWICRLSLGLVGDERADGSADASSERDESEEWIARLLERTVSTVEFEAATAALVGRIDDPAPAPDIAARAAFVVGERHRLDGRAAEARRTFERVLSDARAAGEKSDWVVLAAARCLSPEARGTSSR